MKILYVSHYFPPETGAPAARVHELARRWVRMGHRVTVLTGFPNHPTGIVPPAYRAKWKRLVCRERAAGVEVVRVWLLPAANRGAVRRILSFLSFCLSASIAGMFVGKPDVVIATSPQLLAGLAGWWLSRVERVPFVFEVRDLWPESLEAVGAAGRRSPVYRAAEAVARLLYRLSDRIVVVTPAIGDYLTAHRGIERGKISVVANAVETALFAPGADGGIRGELGLEGRFVVAYFGTLGMAHGLETVLEAAEILRAGDPGVAFLLVGDGAEKPGLRRAAAERGLTNVLFADPQPREAMPRWIRAADVCLVPLKRREVFRTVLPTKFLEAMACGRPVILGVEGQAREILEWAEAGLAVEPENAAALVAAIRRLRADLALRREMGENGRRLVVRHFSRTGTAARYAGVLRAVALRSPRAGARSPTIRRPGARRESAGAN